MTWLTKHTSWIRWLIPERKFSPRPCGMVRRFDRELGTNAFSSSHSDEHAVWTSELPPQRLVAPRNKPSWPIPSANKQVATRTQTHLAGPCWAQRRPPRINVRLYRRPHTPRNANNSGLIDVRVSRHPEKLRTMIPIAGAGRKRFTQTCLCVVAAIRLQL